MQLAEAGYLPGTILIERGTRADYLALAHFHYARGDPAIVAEVWRAVYRDGRADVRNNCKLKIDNSQFAIDSSRVVAVAVLSYPVPSSGARERQLGLSPGRSAEKLRWLNANVRTISRVIVHPQFRSLGLASGLVRRVLLDCPVRYVEAFAVMGKVVPFFCRAGMGEVSDGYFFFDRGSGGRSSDE